jgi:CubicO group peptidase (beta-lactamase class C family)
VDDDPLLDQITARSVLGHTTGWPNWRRKGQPLARVRAPNSAFGYSGEGYSYLQHVVERLTGQPLEVFMREAVLDPLDMASSSYRWAPPDDPTTAAGHDRRGRPRRRLVDDRPMAAASLHSTAGDLARFVSALLAPGNQPGHLRPSSVVEMLRPHVRLNERISWGLGWGLQATADSDAFWHWGDNPGYKSFVLAYRAARLGLVMLTNGDGGLALCEPLLRAALGGESPALVWLAGFYGVPSFGDKAVK